MSAPFRQSRRRVSFLRTAGSVYSDKPLNLWMISESLPRLCQLIDKFARATRVLLKTSLSWLSSSVAASRLFISFVRSSTLYISYI